MCIRDSTVTGQPHRVRMDDDPVQPRQVDRLAVLRTGNRRSENQRDDNQPHEPRYPHAPNVAGVPTRRKASRSYRGNRQATDWPSTTTTSPSGSRSTIRVVSPDGHEMVSSSTREDDPRPITSPRWFDAW